MMPLYAARVSDLKPGDFVIVECASCGHDGLIHLEALPLGLGSNERIADLVPRLRCRECDQKGNAVVSNGLMEHRSSYEILVRRLRVKAAVSADREASYLSRRPHK